MLLIIPAPPPLAASPTVHYRIATRLQHSSEGQGPRTNIFSCLNVVSNVSTARWMNSAQFLTSHTFSTMLRMFQMFLKKEKSTADYVLLAMKLLLSWRQKILATPFMSLSILDWRKVFGRHYYYKYFFEFDIVQIEEVLRNRNYFLRFRFWFRLLTSSGSGSVSRP